PVRLAGRRRHHPGRAVYPLPEPLPGGLGAGGGAADQHHPAARRPDPVRGGRGQAGRRPYRLPAADRGRRRGRVRRRAQRLRADEGHDRGRRRRGAPRGPAGQREEVRPPGRQGAGADPRGGRQAGGRAPGGRRAGRADGAPRPPREAVDKLVAARLAADVLGVPTVLIARTDAEAADLLTSDVDANDRPFCTGERTAEGFHRTRNGFEQAVSRALAYAPYADLLWCETGTPDLEFARRFAEAVHAKFPGKMLAYNCSPSFNWKANLDDATIGRFQKEL